MIEGRKELYIKVLKEFGVKDSEAKKDVKDAIEALVWYAGLSDKW